jgi:hypothetical protein
LETTRPAKLHRLGPLITCQKRLDAFLPDEPLPEKEEKGKKVNHQMSDDNVTEEAVCANCHFIFDIGDRLDPVWKDYERLEETKFRATRPTDGIELVVHDAETRFAIDDTVWNEGLSSEKQQSALPSPYRQPNVMCPPSDFVAAASAIFENG